ncbi:hypothetical protein PIB30_029444 [Stylosanthes scabra]|uniref:F-box domain-containing protein n=1 Tax=Stylosanthes scabra TaxID=79078 RepID=A0ABU6Y9R0_9FABA|nr:hypothetical protein [Stylosanthes scabra]
MYSNHATFFYFPSTFLPLPTTITSNSRTFFHLPTLSSTKPLFSLRTPAPIPIKATASTSGSDDSAANPNWTKWVPAGSLAADKVLRLIAGATASPIGQFVSSPTTFLHSIDPRVKLVWLLALLILPARSHIIMRFGLVVYLTLISVLVLPREVWKDQLGRVYLLSGLLFITLGLGADGVPPLVQSRTPTPALTGLPNIPVSLTGYSYVITKLGPLTFTRKGLSVASTAACLTFMVFQSASLCLTTTTPEQLAFALRWFLLPLKYIGVSVSEIVLTLLLSLRFISLVFDEVRNIALGIVSRRINWKQLSTMETIDIFFNYLRRIFKNIFSHAEQISQAMIVRVNNDNNSTNVVNITNMLQSTTLTENPPKFLSPLEQPFPADVVFDILVRLPVKSLQRFRSACKPWNELISSDRKFAMAQLRRASTTRCDCHHLLVYVHSFADEALTSYVRDYSLIPAFCTSDNYYQPNCPLAEGDWLHFDGNSCHGLVLITVDKFQDAPVLWNPTTGKFKILPRIKNYPMDSCSVHTGLGYDPSTDTYKVVEVSHSDGINIAMVHAVGSDSWREIKNFPVGFPRFNVKFVNDTLNWLLKRDISMGYPPNSSVIVSLDMGMEEFNEISPPMNAIGDLEISILKDWLCIIGHRFRTSDVWVMKEFGRVESWTKLFSIPIYEYDLRSRPIYNIIHSISKDDENEIILLRNKSKFVLYDPKTETFSIPVVEKFQGYSDSRVIIESLVTP